MPSEINWLLAGNFNLIRLPENRNRPGANITEMFLFNEALSALGVTELELYGRKFTWTNKQFSALLEWSDWFFTSQSWTHTFPYISVSTLAMKSFDHGPYLISDNTPIPKGRILHFENNLMEHEQFLNIIHHGLSLPTFQIDATKHITAKFKNLRRLVNAWQAQLSNLKASIANVKLILSFMGILEEFRDLTLMEWNFKSILENRLISLLRQQKIYWKQRSTMRWVTKGDASTNFFHANATIKRRKNLITTHQEHSSMHIMKNPSFSRMLTRINWENQNLDQCTWFRSSPSTTNRFICTWGSFHYWRNWSCDCFTPHR